MKKRRKIGQRLFNKFKQFSVEGKQCVHPKLYFSFRANLRCLLCSDCFKQQLAVLYRANGRLKTV